MYIYSNAILYKDQSIIDVIYILYILYQGRSEGGAKGVNAPPPLFQNFTIKNYNFDSFK